MFPTLLHFFWFLIQAFTVFSLVVPAVFCLLYFVRRAFTKQPAPGCELHEEKDYAIIVMACEPLQNIQATLQSLLQLQYSNYMIYVVGSHPQVTGIRLQSDRVVYLRTATAYHSPLRLQRFAIESFKRPHTHVAILDGNSLVEADYLAGLNAFFNEGYQAVKAHVSYQNRKGVAGILQTATGLYRNFFRGEVLFSLGSSSSLSLTGMAFSVSFYKLCIRRMKTNSADFISSLQKIMIRSGSQVAFAPCAVVYNTTEASYYGMIRHHAQHIHDWLFCLASNSKMAVKGLLKGDVNRLAYSVTSLCAPSSTSVFIGLACLIVNVRINPSVTPLWAGILLLLPVYLAIAAMQLSVYKQRSEIEEQNGDYMLRNIFSAKQENEYDVAVQTI